MVKRTVLFGMLSLSGCWVTSSQVEDKTVVTGQPPVGDLLIDSVKPNYGHSKGNKEIAIQMLEACDSPSVKLGDKTALVVEQSTQQIVVRTPALDGGQWVDIEVKCDNGQAVLERGFQVFKNASGLVRSAGEFSWVEHIGEYWVAEITDYGYASVYLFDPILLEYSSFFGTSLDRCESGYERGTVGIDSMAELTDTLTLSSGDADIDLSYDSEKGYYSSELQAGDYARNVVYDLYAFGDTSPWSEEDVLDFVETPSGEMSITQPAMDGSNPPTIQSEFDLAWPGAGQGDYILGVINRYRSDGSYEKISCLLRDDGHFRVDANVFDGWSTGQLMTVRLGRVKRSSGSFPQDDAGSGVVGVYWVMGAGYQL